MSASPVPQDIVAIFHASFHPTQGNIIDWQLKTHDELDLSHVEFSCLPSGLHLVEEDVVYFTKGEHQGVCVFKRRQTTERGHRGFRLSSLGILLAKSSRSRPWRHVPALKSLVHTIYSSLEDRDALEPAHSDWDPARDFFEQRRFRGEGMADTYNWVNWDTELDPSEFELVKTSPTVHLPHLLKILGPSSLTLYKHVLGRRRILIYTAPPVEAACILCHVAADICLEDQVFTASNNDDTLPDRPLGVSSQGIKVLGMITLNDLDRLGEESKNGRGWIACTTDAIFLDKPAYYDLVIDLTTTSLSKGTRPTFYMSKPVDQPRDRQPTHRLSTVRFTWSDVKLWTELYRLLQQDSHSHHDSCCDPNSSSSSPSSSSSSKTRTGWSEVWRVYEDVCVLCAGLWMGTWKGPTLSPYCRPGEENENSNWGSIRLEGEDYISVVRSEGTGGGAERGRERERESTYVRNVGMGVEGRGRGRARVSASEDTTTTNTPSTPNGLHNRTRSTRRTSAMSMWTWASGRGPTVKQLSLDADDSDSPLSHDSSSSNRNRARQQERINTQISMTLALLQTFHNNTSALLAQLATFLPKHSSLSSPSSSSSPSPSNPSSPSPSPSTQPSPTTTPTSNTRTPSNPSPHPQPHTIHLTPRDITSFDLGAFSTLDHRFIEWLGEEYGARRGVRIVVRKGWRDFVGLVVGLG